VQCAQQQFSTGRFVLESTYRQRLGSEMRLWRSLSGCSLRLAIVPIQLFRKEYSMYRLFYRASAVAIYALLVLATRVHAIPIALTDRAAFDGALGALTSVSVATETFDSTAAGTLIGNGGAIGSLTFAYPALAGFGVTLQITTGATTSPSNFLGSDDGGVLQGGDELVISFSPLHAFGLYLIVDAGLGAIADGDLTLSGGGTTASLLSSAQQSFALGNNLQVYFLGLVDALAPFSSVTLQSSGAFFTYTLDDIVSAAPVSALPEPGGMLLSASALLGLAAANAMRRRGQARRDNHPLQSINS
jgi:hypothetical protein